MSRTTRSYPLRRKERKSLLRNISLTLGIDTEELFGLKPNVQVIDISRYKIFILNNYPILAQFKKTLFPTLLFTDYLGCLPNIIVDMGAIPYICNGADIMAPGVVSTLGDFIKGELVTVLDERNRQPIAVARSIFDSKTSRNTNKGRLYKNIHYIGDEVWDVIKK